MIGIIAHGDGFGNVVRDAPAIEVHGECSVAFLGESVGPLLDVTRQSACGVEDENSGYRRMGIRRDREVGATALDCDPFARGLVANGSVTFVV